MSDLWEGEGRDIGLSAKRVSAVRLAARTGYCGAGEPFLTSKPQYRVPRIKNGLLGRGQGRIFPTPDFERSGAACEAAGDASGIFSGVLLSQAIMFMIATPASIPTSRAYLPSLSRLEILPDIMPHPSCMSGPEPPVPLNPHTLFAKPQG